VSRTYEEPESNTRYSGEKGGNRKSEETNEEFDSRYDRLFSDDKVHPPPYYSALKVYRTCYQTPHSFLHSLHSSYF
jgi:hypothetical protein